MPFERKGKCVFRKDTGKKKGCSKSVEGAKKYMKALYVHSEDIDKYATGDEKKILTEKWVARLSEVYDSFEEFKEYDEIYNLAKRLGFDSAEDAWLSNPKITGSVNPADYKTIDRGNPKKTNKEDVDKYATEDEKIFLKEYNSEKEMTLVTPYQRGFKAGYEKGWEDRDKKARGIKHIPFQDSI